MSARSVGVEIHESALLQVGMLLILVTISLVAAEKTSEGCDEVYKPQTSFTYTNEADSSGKYPVGTQVTVSCGRKVVLRGNPQGTCTENGWEPLPGICLSACYNRDLITELQYEDVFNGDKDGWTKNGASVKAICSHTKNKAPKGQIRTHIRTCANGNWHPAYKCSQKLGPQIQRMLNGF